MPLQFNSNPANGGKDYKYPSVKFSGFSSDDLIEVRDDLTFRRHYLQWDSQEADFSAYYLQATAQLPATAYKLRFCFVTPKDSLIRSTDTRADDFWPLEAKVHTSGDTKDAFMKALADLDRFLVGSTRGYLKTSFKFADVPRLLWENKGGEWYAALHKTPTKEILQQHLLQNGWTQDEIDEINVWILVADGTPEPVIGQFEKSPGYALQFGGVTLFNGLQIRVPQGTGMGVLIHELTHHFTAAFRKTDGYEYCPFHGGGQMGYADEPPVKGDWIGSKNPQGLFDRNMLLYYISPVMWERYGQKPTEQPPAAGPDVSFRYRNVYRDLPHLLPTLSQDDISALLGVKVIIEAEDTFTLFKVYWRQRNQVSSPHHTSYVSQPEPSNCLDRAVNNLAVLRVPSGHWLFVKLELAELFADMPRQADYSFSWGQNYLPLYGWCYESTGNKGLILMKAPAELEVPTGELRYFMKGV